MEENIVIRERKDFYKLFALMEKEIPDISIAIFLEMPALEPIDVLMLTQFAIIKLGRNCEVKIIADESMQQYIAAIGLVDFIHKNATKPETIDAIPSYSSMPIRRVERETMVEYIDATSKYFKSICADKDLTMLDLCMAELINNVYDHSFSPIGAYVFCQFYPVKAEIKMAVSDYGIGIPSSVNHYLLAKGKNKLSDMDCVKWSIKENKTTQSIPQNAGKGLDNVNTFVRRNQGSWKLWTNNVILNGRIAGNSYGDNPIYGFKGTLAQISININNLAVSETVNDFSWDF